MLLYSEDGKSLIWQSSLVSDQTEAVRIDVWNGRFAGSASEWVVLEPGKYKVRWQSLNGQILDLGPLNIESQELWMEDLTTKKEGWLDHPDPWQKDGQWKTGNSGLTAKTDTAHFFRQGAMHGNICVTYTLPEQIDSGRCWGMVARVYNAFNHLRVVICKETDRLSIQLIRVENGKTELKSYTVLASCKLDWNVSDKLRINWVMNGSCHTIFVNENLIIRASDGYMGGVDIVGFFADHNSVAVNKVRMETTQTVPLYTVRHNQYSATIRPGNIRHLYFPTSAAPNQDIFWESGIQFGHIGGSEIKFTQGATQKVIDEGPVATVVNWSGPMPKFVDRSDDVRGFARGSAIFYPDRIIIDDTVLNWVQRTVGPDIDVLGRLMTGSARVAFGQDKAFEQWQLPADGHAVFPPKNESGELFPILMALPMGLGNQTWWLKALITLRRPASGLSSGHVVGWQCPFGLTASYNIRVAQPKPGLEYAYTIVVCWQHCDDHLQVEQDLLNLRDDWMAPMAIEAIQGQTVEYPPNQENPKEAIDFDGCFDRTRGCHVIDADKGKIQLRLDPGDIWRRGVNLAVRNWPNGSKPICCLNGNPLSQEDVIRTQEAGHGELLVSLGGPIDQVTELSVAAEEEKQN